VPHRLIVVAGENLIDRIVSPDGRTVDVPGGGPFNTARALRRLGARVAYLGRISTDANGQRIRKALIDDGVDLSLAVTTHDPTLIAHATLDAAGAATYRFDWEGSAAAGLRAEDLPADLPADVAALHVGTLGLVLEPMATTIAGLVGRIGPDVLLMLDPNIRPSAIEDEAGYRSRLAAIVGRADVIKASKEDVGWLESASWADLDDKADDPWALIITDGPSFIEVHTSKTWAVHVVPPREVVDTVGAGDAFSAGFLARWVEEGHPRADVADPAKLALPIRYGIAAAGWTVERVGADPPRLADLGEVF
jgi:fructokinase